MAPRQRSLTTLISSQTEWIVPLKLHPLDPILPRRLLHRQLRPSCMERNCGIIRAQNPLGESTECLEAIR